MMLLRRSFESFPYNLMMYYWAWYVVILTITIHSLSVVSAEDESITIDWFIPTGDDRLPPITAHVGDTLEFIWSGVHNVHLHPSGTCDDRTNSIEIGSISGTTFTLMESHIGTHFFACQIGPHCDLGLHLTVTVEATLDDEHNATLRCRIPPDEDDEAENKEGVTTTTTTTTADNGLRTFSGILLLKCIGRPPVLKQDLKTMEQVIKDVYQRMTGTCTQPGVIRELKNVEIVKLFSTLDNDVIDLNTGGEMDDGMAADGTTLRFLQSSKTSSLSELPSHIIKDKHNLDRFMLDDETRSSTRYLQMSHNMELGGNNNTNHTHPVLVTQPMTWIARLSGTCNGCKFGESLFANDDDVSGRRILEGIEQQYQFQIMALNRNHKHTATTTFTALRGGGDATSSKRNDIVEDENWKTPQRSLQNDDEICNCPGPTLNSFEESLTNQVIELARIGEFTNIDEIEASIVLEEQHQNCSSTNIELFCTSITIHVMEERMMCTPNNHTNHTNMTTTDIMMMKPSQPSTTSSMFKNPEALKHFSTIYGARYNNANLLNGETCDPYFRRIQSIQGYYIGRHKGIPGDDDEEDEHDGMRRILQNDTEVPPEHETTGGACHTIMFRSIIRLEITAECIGCNGTLFDDEEDDEDERGDSINGTRHLRELQNGMEEEGTNDDDDDDDKEVDEDEEMDWYPFCFCPVNATLEGLKVSHFRNVLNDALHIIQREQGISWRLEGMGNMESINCTSSETATTLSPMNTTTSAPDPVETDAPTSTTTDPPVTSPPTPEPVVTPAPTPSPSKSNPACLDDGVTVDLTVDNTGLYCEGCTELQTLELECGPGQENYECSCVDLTIMLWDDDCNAQAGDIEDVYAELCSTPEPTDAPTTPEPTDAPTTTEPTDAPTPEPTAAPTTPEPTDAPTTPEPTDAPTQAPTRSNPACDENGEDVDFDVDNTEVYCEGCSQLQTLELECGPDEYECDCILDVIDLWDSECNEAPGDIDNAWEEQCNQLLNPGCLANGEDINKDADNGFYCDDACTFTQIALLKCGSFDQNFFNCLCFLRLETDEELTVCGYTLEDVEDVDQADLPEEAVALIDYCTTTFGSPP